MDIDHFIKIFSIPKYRKKLDKIILNFFGLKPIDLVNGYYESEYGNVLEFIITFNKQYLFKIVVYDTKNLFNCSKKFYLNFSLEKNDKGYTLLYPCYWEFYCNSCLSSYPHKKCIEWFASLFATTDYYEIKTILKHLRFHVFDRYKILMIIKNK